MKFRVRLAAVLLAAFAVMSFRPSHAEPAKVGEVDRSPVDLLVSSDEKWLVTANQTSGTVSLVDIPTGQVLAEVPVGRKPSALAMTADGKTILVTCTWTGELIVLDRSDKSLAKRGSLHLGFEPRGVALSPNGATAYVALTTAHAVAVVELASMKETGRIATGRWPRYLAITPDGKHLAVGANSDGGVSVLDLEKKELAFQENFVAINLGQMQIAKDGKQVYLPWVSYGANPISPGNIRIGWVLASRIAKVRLDEKTRREAISLDPPGIAVADPFGLAVNADESHIVCSASGTHELLVFKNEKLPFMDFGGPGDHMDSKLRADKDRFWRIPLGGRPMFLRFAADGKRVFVANYLLNAVQVVDVVARKVKRTILLGGPAEPSLARKGEAIFHDGKRSLDQWFSCATCHYEGHTNARTIDTRNDGSIFTFKTVLSLRHVTETGPWFWHGWQKDLDEAISRSFTESMQGKAPTDDELLAVKAYLATLDSPPNPNRLADGSLNEAAKRGEAVFRGSKAGCVTCHKGPNFADDRVHDVGTGARSDVYKGYSTPSLRNIYDRPLLLHDGRAKSLEDVLRGAHAPDKVVGNGTLTEDELLDLIEYLKSI